MIDLSRVSLLRHFGGNLVHERVRDNELAAARHQSFIVSHFFSAALALAVLIAYVIVTPEPPVVVVAALMTMVLPVFAAVLLMRTGSLAIAHLLSTLIFAALVAGIAAVTGGISSFAIAWILVIPVEAAMSGSRRVVVGAVAFCIVELIVLAFLDHAGYLSASLVPALDTVTYLILGLGGALAYIGMLSATIEYHYEKSEDVVQDSEERYRLLAESATDMITRHGPNGDVLFVSGAADRLVECSTETLYGDGFLNLVHPDDRHVYVTAFVKATDTGGAATAEFRLASGAADAPRERSYRWVELNCRTIMGLGSERSTRQLVAVTRDISGRKKRQEDLRQARDDAEQASRAKTNFLANMSHELRTPLNSVIGFAELLEREMSADEKFASQQEYAFLIRQSGEHLLGVVNDLLNLSRIEAGQVSLYRELIDLNEVADYCRRSLATVAQEDQLEIVLDFDAGELLIEADRKACTQIILNLLSNAIKFSKPSSVVVIATRSNETSAELSVRDQGVGIAPDVIGKLGQPFTQGDEAYSRAHDGVGLGLSIVKGLVSFHNGDLNIESTQGVGTTVTVSLPFGDPATEEVTSDKKEASELDVTPSSV
jgi:cell cycle sensor histidine kinase DivJ